MPSSSKFGKNWTKNVVNKIKQRFEVERVLDIGVGEGTYLTLLKNVLPKSNWIGVEIWEPYINKFDLKSKYNTIIQSDAREVDYSSLGKMDIVFAGDILEHMTKEEAVELTNKILLNSQCFLVSIPIIYAPQDEYEGNPYEIHVKPDWSNEEFFNTFGELIVDHVNEEYMGVYLLSTDSHFIEKYKKAKTCVYGIALNEIKHVDRFMESCKDADMVLICDTGSTDGTAERLEELGATVYKICQRPWRFDYARNTALSLIPRDVDLCLHMDLDEILLPGWNEALQKTWKEHNGKINRIGYDFTASWMPDGVTPAVTHVMQKWHSRFGYCWKHPCHEMLTWIGEGEEKCVEILDIKVHHRQDYSKSRGQYLPLMEIGVKEDPHNDRIQHWYARELMYYKQYEKSIEELKKHLDMPSAKWEAERAASYIYMAECYKGLNQHKKAQQVAFNAIMECNYEREPWLALARTSYTLSDWQTAYYAVKKCLSLTQRPKHYLSHPESWSYTPYDIGALAAYHLKLYKEAVELGELALEKSPNDERLKNNLVFYKQAMEK